MLSVFLPVCVCVSLYDRMTLLISFHLFAWGCHVESMKSIIMGMLISWKLESTTIRTFLLREPVVKMLTSIQL